MSTARTTIGCLAEDYSAHLALICANWLETEERYYTEHPSELTDEVRLTMDVARSFVAVNADRARRSQ